MMDLAVVFAMVILHSPDGREIDVAVDQITSIHCKIPNVENQLFAQGINAIVNLSDGKHVSVVESCNDIRYLLRENTK